MIPKEILKKIRRLQIVTNRVVSDVFAGEYLSVFKGRGMEFNEVREYQPGDEERDIDWNVTARMGRPFVKKFVEERELTVMLLVDASASSRFGTRDRFKSELAAELCAVLAFSAIRNKDRVGLVIFTDRIEKFVPPGKGSRHVLRVIREVLYFRPQGRGTDISEALDYLNRVIRRRSVVFLVSDFLSAGFERALRVSARRHDLVALLVRDPREEELLPAGLVRLEDAESGKEVLLDTSSPLVRSGYARTARERREAAAEIFRSGGVDWMNIRTGEPYEPVLLEFFHRRERRVRH